VRHPPPIPEYLDVISLEGGAMKLQRISAILTVVNLALLAFLLNQVRTVEASNAPAVLRGRALEIVDAQGKLRASLQVIPKGPSRGADGSVIDPGGKSFPEAVVFRLIRPDGRPSVKIATTEQGSGLDLSGGIDPTYIVLSADGGDASITVTNKDNHRQVVTHTASPQVSRGGWPTSSRL
jgi:hypothetical protein